VRLAVAEAAGEGIANRQAARRSWAARRGSSTACALNTCFRIDPRSQVIEAVSISAGLDYPGIGPQLAALMEAGG